MSKQGPRQKSFVHKLLVLLKAKLPNLKWDSQGEGVLVDPDIIINPRFAELFNHTSEHSLACTFNRYGFRMDKTYENKKAKEQRRYVNEYFKRDNMQLALIKSNQKQANGTGKAVSEGTAGKTKRIKKQKGGAKKRLTKAKAQENNKQKRRGRPTKA